MTSNKRTCAFCGVKNNLSREHIFPNGIIKKFEYEMLSYNDKSNKIFRTDMVVKDVCETCNNGILSKLDSHFVQLFEKNMQKPIYPGHCVEFEFEYNFLLRELLKISFNSARASSDGFKAVKALRKYVPYILGHVSEAPGIMLRLQIVTSAKPINSETHQIERMMEAELLRSCKIEYRGPQHFNFLIRLVAINSFWFYIFLPLQSVSQNKKARFLAGFLEFFHLKGVPIINSMNSVSIPREKTTYMHPNLFEGLNDKRAYLQQYQA